MRLSKMRFNLNLYSCYRTELMGFAAILIILCHAPSKEWGIPYINYLLCYGNLGVEIFFFLSGLGLAFSLSRHQGSLLPWYKKRYLRILVPYLLIAVPWYYYKYLLGAGDFTRFVINVSTLNYWLYHGGAWFVAVLMPLYLVTPLLFKIMHYHYGYAILIFLSVTCSLLVVFEPSNIGNVFGNIIGTAKRLPCFFLGMIFSYAVKKHKKTPILPVIAIAAFFFVIYKFAFGDGRWLLVFLLIPLVCVSIKKSDILRTIFAFMGNISLESYIANICLLDLGLTYVKSGGIIRYVIVVAIGIIVAYAVSKLKKILI